jgi:TolB-like protein/Tfp pilus assembly protein PilF
MAASENPVRALIAELRRRRVFRVAVVYAAVAWALIETTNTILPRLALPEWTVTLVIVLVLLGFPLALVFAWVFDVTPEGVRRTTDVSATPSTLPRAALLVVVVVLLTAAIVLRTRGARDVPGGGAAAEIHAIAVMPFQNASPDAGDAYLSDGIAEELLHRLASVPELRVAARTSSFALRSQEADMRAIGAALGVDAVLEGSVRKLGDRLRIVARLVSTRDGYQLWSEIYERDASDVFRVQDEISAAIVARLRPEYAEANASSPAAGPSPEAFDLYLKGKHEWHRRTEPGAIAAVELFSQAIALSPNYARAHLGLADAYAVIGFYDYMPPAEAFARAREAARRALALDPGMAEAHASLGYVALYHDWDFAAAEREFERALELNPRHPVAHQWYGNALTVMGRFDEAVAAMHRAQELDPLALITHAAEGWTWFYARNYERAIEQSRRTLARDSTYFLANLWWAQALVQSGRAGEAIPVLERALRMQPYNAMAEAERARAHAFSSRTDEARAILQRLERRGTEKYVPSYEIATIHIALGDHDAALERLRRAAAERAHSIAFLAVDPRLDPLRPDVRFEQLTRETIRP